MKKGFFACLSMILMLSLALVCLSSCACDHLDKNDDGYCDKCEAKFEDGKDLPDPCQHRDADDNTFCDKCGESYSDEEDIKEHIHVYDKGIVDDKYLASVADCENASTYYYSCSCGERGSSVFSSGAPNGHSYTVENTDIKYFASDATAEIGPKYYYSCICGRKGHETFIHGNVLENELVYWRPDGSSYYIVTGIVGTLENVVIPDTHNTLPVTAIGANAFSDCSSITSITIPDSVTSIGHSAFHKCDNLTDITIPDSVTEIGNSAFYGCINLMSITIPDSVTSVGRYAFLYCDGITIYCETNSEPSSWNSNWNYSSSPVVWNCKNTDVAADGYIYTVENGIKYALKDEKATVARQKRTITVANILSSVSYKGSDYSVTEIADYAFLYCDSLNNVTIPDGVVKIGAYAFQYCDNLTSVSIPGSMTEISNHSFYSCYSLTSITIPDSVSIIGESAFENCESLTIYCEYESKPSDWDLSRFHVVWNCNSNDVADNGYIYTVVDGIRYALKDGEATVAVQPRNITIASILANISYKESDYSVTEIANYAFQFCDNLTSVSIPDSVTKIGDLSLHSCNNLTTIIIPDSVTYIGANAFRENAGLTSVVIGDGVIEMRFSTFALCDNLTRVVIGNSVTKIEDETFYNCTNLKTIIIGNNITEIGSSAFYSCQNLTDVYYIGSEEEWAEINIHSGNDYLTNATIHYNYTGE